QYKEDFVNLCEDGKVLVEGALPDIIKQDLDKVHLKQLIDHILKICQRKLKSALTKKFQCVSEGIDKAGNPTPLNNIYTDLYITESGTKKVNEEHEFRHIETVSRKQNGEEATIGLEQLFRGSPGQNNPVRTVITRGVAGIGKTVLTQKFTLDWAENKTNQDIQFIFPFTFRELNALKGKEFSLMELVHHFFPETKEICEFIEFQVIFIFDGLDECRLPLDFKNNDILTDITKPVSVDALLTNLIRGKLLPTARLWITTRPAAASRIPPDYVDMVTEVSGFDDPQKEEYFRKRFRDEELASKIISHIKTSKTLHNMCHIPLFCWIAATVVENVFKTSQTKELPKTMTEMYIHYLLVQTKVKMVKYDGNNETDEHWSSKRKEMMKSLGKLAFEQLQKGNLIFYESDLRECEISLQGASEYSGMFTEIFKVERVLSDVKLFSFVHLSIQEFLAALHVHLTFTESGVNRLKENTLPTLSALLKKPTILSFYHSAVNKTLQSPNGHLDLFLRFLLGLSLETNQKLLHGLLKQTERSSQINQKTAQYIKEKISENLSTEKSINLFHCLNELNDGSLMQEIQQFLSAGTLRTDKLSPAQWSALVCFLLSSEENLDVFNFTRFSVSENILLRLLPLIKVSKKAVLEALSSLDLSNNNLQDSGMKQIVEGLGNIQNQTSQDANSTLSPSASLKELDLSNNNLQDSGVKLLSTGLESSYCRLETLRLSGCMVTGEGFASLASALNSNSSHLRELDLTFNHSDDAGVKLLSANLKDPQSKLEVLRYGKAQFNHRQIHYYCKLTVDTNSMNRNVKLSDNNTKASYVEEAQPYPDHPDRFEKNHQVMCSNGLTGRCYWEVELMGGVHTSVSCKGIIRRGEGNDGWFGGNDQSWTLFFDGNSYSVWHNKKGISIPYTTVVTPTSSHRVAVYLDWPAGTLSFYRVSSDTLIHIHTFHTTFTEALYPGFGLWSWVNAPKGSSVQLISLFE
uniref:B30.2/SPRY domain-containing protein n=1 Tax=Xiphophorus maculatus TaxID=8083 RepID=A0A3B5R0Y3_XIPMA